MIILKNKLYQPISVFVNQFEDRLIKAKGTIQVPGDEVTNHMIQLKEAGWLTIEVRKTNSQHLRKKKQVISKSEPEAEVVEAEAESEEQ